MNFMIKEGSGIVIRNLELNTSALKEMGGEFILSAVEILNDTQNHLEFLRTFEDRSSPWKIYLYKIRI